jgi:hypothetical protein
VIVVTVDYLAINLQFLDHIVNAESVVIMAIQGILEIKEVNTILVTVDLLAITL